MDTKTEKASTTYRINYRNMIKALVILMFCLFIAMAGTAKIVSDLNHKVDSRTKILEDLENNIAKDVANINEIANQFNKPQQQSPEIIKFFDDVRQIHVLLCLDHPEQESCHG